MRRQRINYLSDQTEADEKHGAHFGSKKMGADQTSGTNQPDFKPHDAASLNMTHCNQNLGV